MALTKKPPAKSFFLANSKRIKISIAKQNFYLFQNDKHFPQRILAAFSDNPMGEEPNF